MDFDRFIDQAWSDHAADPRRVAQHLSQGLALTTDEAQLVRLADLAHHVHGAHLADWPAGRAFNARLAALPAYTPDGASGQAWRRCAASLALCEQPDTDLSELSECDRIRVGAMASTNLAEHDTARASALLQDALDRAQRSSVPATDPMHRALAVAGHNLACTLEDKSTRSVAERDLMILAAQASRGHWELAGTWLEVERAEYRLAMTWLQAGDAARARQHAQACLGIVSVNGGAALERFFGCEALARAERTAGNVAGHAQALAGARAAFADLDPSDRVWCAASLDPLGA